MKLDDLVNRDKENVRRIIGEPEKVKKNQWKFAIDKDESVVNEGKEIKMKSNEEFYGGKFVRDLIESREYRPKSYTWLGFLNDSKKGVKEIGIPYEALNRHTAIFGKSGTGKSTIIKNMLLQWIYSGKGLCFIDPKGHDSPELLEVIPENRKDDVVWLQPGAEQDGGYVGFNILEVPSYEDEKKRANEEQMLIENLMLIFEKTMGEDKWSARIEGVLNAILGVLISSDHNYTLSDLYKILKDQSEREVFVDTYRDQLDNLSVEYINELDPSNVEDLIQELRRTLSNETIRSLISEEESSITISEIIDENKILLCDVSNVSEDNLEFLTAIIVRRIWSKIKTRGKNSEYFYLCIDEIDNATKDMQQQNDFLGIGTLISVARSFNMPIIVATQQPSQLAQDVKEEVFGCHNIYTFQQDTTDGAELAEQIKDDDFGQYDIMELNKYNLVGTINIPNGASTGVIIETFPQYPPLRKEKGVEEIIKNSIRSYGTKELEDFNEEKYGVINAKNESESSEEINKVNIDEERTITTYHSLILIKSILEKKPDYTATDTEIKEAFAPFIGKNYEEVKNETINPYVGSKLEQKEYTNYTLTREGENYIDNRLTNSERKVLKYLSELGYNITKPLSSLDSTYDLSGFPPIQPARESKTISEVNQLKDILKQSSPKIYKLSEDKKLLLSIYEDEDDLEKIARNIVKARQDIYDLIIDMTNSKEDLLKKLGKGETLPLIRKKMGNERYLYTTDQQLPLEDGKIPVRQNETEWVEKDGKILLISGDENILEFDDYQDIRNKTDPKKLNYYGDLEDGKLLIQKKKDGEHKTSKEINNGKKTLEKLNVVKRPLNPEMGRKIDSIQEERWRVLNMSELKQLVNK